MEISIERYKSFIESVAKSAHYVSNVVSYEDLYQVGALAAINAVKSHNPTYGAKLSSYVRSAIFNAIYDEAAKFYGTFTVSKGILKLATKVNKLIQQGKTDEEILKALSSDKTRLFTLEHIRDLRYLYENPTCSAIEEEEPLTIDFSYDAIGEAIEQISWSDNEVYVIKHRLLGNDKVSKVAQHLNLSNAYIYELEQRIRSRIWEKVSGT